MKSDATEPKRPTPEEILARIEKEAQKENRGRLKLFLGFAAGVGKTYTMLNEANRRHSVQGQDVVIGIVVTHGRTETVAQLGDLESVPLKKIVYKDSEFEEMDTDAVIARKPQWVVVDELAHTNVPGSPREKRYEDVFAILDAGINVLSAMNVQHLESLNDNIMQITGVKVRETVPDWVLGRADEVVNIDITPRALVNRLQRGNIYATEKVPQALANFFTEGNLGALREIALREVAKEVDRSVQTYREEHGVETPWKTHEKVMVCISPDQPSDRIIRRGWRVANRLKAELVCIYVSAKMLRPHQQKILDADFKLAQSLNMPIEEIPGKDIAQTLANYALTNCITQIIIGHSNKNAWERMTKGAIDTRIVELVPGIDVLILGTPADK